MAKIDSLKILNDDQENRKILTKLPEWLLPRWSRRVAEYKEQHKKFPPFTVFVDFLSEEAKIAADPVTSIEAVIGHQSQKATKTTAKSVRTLSTTRTPKDSSEQTVQKPESEFSVPCIVCQQRHQLTDYQQFQGKTLEELIEFVKRKGLCFGCLRRGHLSRTCKTRKTCDECGKRHPTVMHGALEVAKVSSDCKDSGNKMSLVHLSASSTGDKSSMIVPVWISHRDQPRSERLIYALLDTQSDTSFILDSTADALGQKGTQVSLLLSTLGATRQRVDSSVISG